MLTALAPRLQAGGDGEGAHNMLASAVTLAKALRDLPSQARPWPPCKTAACVLAAEAQAGAGPAEPGHACVSPGPHSPCPLHETANVGLDSAPAAAPTA